MASVEKKRLLNLPIKLVLTQETVAIYFGRKC